MTGFEELYNNYVKGKITEKEYESNLKQIESMQKTAKRDEDMERERLEERGAQDIDLWADRQYENSLGDIAEANMLEVY